MIERTIKQNLLIVAQVYPVIAILGPRQSGKTTVAQQTFPNYKYVSLEEIDNRKFAIEDPRGFLAAYDNEYGVIIDEFQHAPDLLSYIQTKVDREQKQGYFILTGSQNFLMNQAISQSLAGRISINTLLPLSVPELKESNLLSQTVNELLYKGFYPPVYVKNVEPEIWYKDYSTTYLERDIRQLTQVADLNLFQMFVQLCAGRIGQVLNITSLANDCGISDTTVQRWLSLLEATYIIYLMQPHHTNLGKRLIKSPKLFFYDVGLATSLLNIQKDQIASSYMRGALFESFVISDIIKQFYNAGKRPHIYFWRDHVGHEVDCIIEVGNILVPVEIKAGQTISNDYFKGLAYWNELATGSPEGGYVIYGGTEPQKRTVATVLSWNNLDQLMKMT